MQLVHTEEVTSHRPSGDRYHHAPSAAAGASPAADHACEWWDCFSSAVRPMWCQRPGVTQRKTVRPGRLHQHVSVQPQRRRGPPIPSASAARVPTASRRTPAALPRCQGTSGLPCGRTA